MKLFNLTTIGLIGLTTSAFSAPSAFEAKDCAPLKINNSTTSTLIRDHQDCSKIWVMPPDMGKVTTRHFKKSGNLGFCAEMKNIQSITRKISAKIGLLQKDIDEQSPSIRKAELKVQQAEELYAKAKNSPEILTFSNLQDRRSEIEIRLVELQDKITNCNNLCNSLIRDFNDLREEKRNLNTELRKLRSTNRQAITNFERAKSKLDGALRHFEFVEEEVLSIVEKQSRLSSKLFGLYRNYAKLEGGFIGINYDLNWDENVNHLESQYEQYNFSKVATKDARIHANFIGSTDQASYLESLPMILDYTIAGFEYQPYGVEKEPALSSVPSEIQGDLRLSVVGACPYYYSNFLDDNSGELEINPNAQSDQFGFGLSMSYKSPAVFKFNLEASYNLYKFYKKVVSSGSKGGFFSKKSWKKVSETKIDKDTFDIKWLDEGSMYTQEEKTKIRKTVKEELMARALQNMAEPAGSRPSRMTAIDTFNPEPGALVVARGLEKTCGWYSYYCRAGGWILKGLTSIFGSSKSEATFQSTHDSTATEIWNEENVLWRPGASSFVEK
jgi:hypothetical protein